MKQFKPSKNYDRNINRFVFGMRIVFGLLVFVNAFAAWAIAIFLDLVDGRIVRGYNAKLVGYVTKDKLTDTIINLIFLIYALLTYNPTLQLLFTFAFLWRLAGVILYAFTRKRALFVLFSNMFFEFFGLISLLQIVNPELLKTDSTVVMLFIIVAILKIPMEFAYHYSAMAASDADMAKGVTFVNRLFN